MSSSTNSVSPLTQKTNGGVNEHTLNLLYTMPVTDKHQLLIGASVILHYQILNKSLESNDLKAYDAF